MNEGNGAETMTSQQRDELQQAILRAERDGITILARGTRKSDGARVWGVTSKSKHDHRLHQVVQVGGRLLCDCPSRVICKHRGLVHADLVAEASRTPAAAPAVDEQWSNWMHGGACSCTVTTYSTRFRRPDGEPFPLGSWQSQLRAILLLAALPLCALVVALYIPRPLQPSSSSACST